MRKKTVDMDVLEKRAVGKIGVYYSQKFYFEFIDSLSKKSDTLPQFFARAIPDENPAVKIIRPGMNADLSVAQRETLYVEAFDDYGFDKLTLFWQRSGDSDTIYNKKNIALENPLLEMIKDEFKDSWQIALQAREIIQNELGLKVCDDETGYLTIHIDRLKRLIEK